MPCLLILNEMASTAMYKAEAHLLNAFHPRNCRSIVLHVDLPGRYSHRVSFSSIGSHTLSNTLSQQSSSEVKEFFILIQTTERQGLEDLKKARLFYLFFQASPSFLLLPDPSLQISVSAFYSLRSHRQPDLVFPTSSKTSLPILT